MKTSILSLLGILAIHCAAAETTWTVGQRLRVTLPESYTVGVPFPVKLEFLEKPAVAQKVGLGFDHLLAKGAFGGKLQPIPLRLSVAGPVTFNETLTIREAKPGLTVALFTVFLSPDGTWKNRTLQAVFPIQPAAGTDEALWRKCVERARAQDGAPPDYEAAIEDYAPRAEYFTQRKDNPDARSWKITPQSLPPLADIVAKPGEDRPVYGIYCWAGEYEKAAAEIAKIGIKSLRIGGPWEGADNALKLAHENGAEVLFTLKSGAGKDTYKARRGAFESDEAFLAAFKSNVAAFAKRYGPGGEFEKALGIPSPVAVVEMWNEPNFFYMIDDMPDRKAVEKLREELYPKVLKAGYEAVKSIAPGLKVAAFGAGGADSADIRFIENIFSANPGIAGCFDILSTHPYNKGAPPEAEKIRNWGSYSISNNLAKIKDIMGPAAASKSIWYTELGWHFAGKHGGQYETPKMRVGDCLTPDLHAAYVVRMYLRAMRLGVPRVHIMHLHDADAFNGGFLGRDLSWRPVAHATRNLIALMPNPKLTGAVSDGEDNLHIHTFKADHKDPASRDVIAAWCTTGPAAVSVPVRGSEVEVLDMVGNRKSLPAADGRVRIEIGPYPVYILQ